MKTIFLYLIAIIISFNYFVKGNINYIKNQNSFLNCNENILDKNTDKNLEKRADYASNAEQCNNLLTDAEKENDSCCYISVQFKNNTWYNYCGKISNTDKKDMDNVINYYIGNYSTYIYGDDNEKMKKSLKIDCLGERFNFKFIILLISLLSFI